MRAAEPDSNTLPPESPIVGSFDDLAGRLWDKTPRVNEPLAPGAYRDTTRPPNRLHRVLDRAVLSRPFNPAPDTTTGCKATASFRITPTNARPPVLSSLAFFATYHANTFRIFSSCNEGPPHSRRRSAASGSDATPAGPPYRANIRGNVDEVNFSNPVNSSQ